MWHCPLNFWGTGYCWIIQLGAFLWFHDEWNDDPSNRTETLSFMPDINFSFVRKKKEKLPVSVQIESPRSNYWSRDFWMNVPVWVSVMKGFMNWLFVWVWVTLITLFWWCYCQWYFGLLLFGGGGGGGGLLLGGPLLLGITKKVWKLMLLLSSHYFWEATSFGTLQYTSR